MGGKTSAKVKNANTKKNYDRIFGLVPKGMRAYYQDEAKKAGLERNGEEYSLAAYIRYCMDKEIEERTGKKSSQ